MGELPNGFYLASPGATEKYYTVTGVPNGLHYDSAKVFGSDRSFFELDGQPTGAPGTHNIVILLVGTDGSFWTQTYPIIVVSP